MDLLQTILVNIGAFFPSKPLLADYVSTYTLQLGPAGSLGREEKGVGLQLPHLIVAYLPVYIFCPALYIPIGDSRFYLDDAFFIEFCYSTRGFGYMKKHCQW